MGIHDGVADCFKRAREFVEWAVEMEGLGSRFVI